MMEGEKMDALVMISTAGSEKEARRIARTLVEDRLAACVNVIPGMTSFFFWGGKFCRQKEALIVVKTVGKRSKEIINKIKKMHGYEVPEVISLKVHEGEKNYLHWLNKMVK